MSLPQKPFYRFAPVKDIQSLAETLLVTPLQLERIAANADKMYRHVPQKKKDGSTRDTWDAYAQLKAVQERLKNQLLQKVEYPLYLQGGIRDINFPRDYTKNAAIHAGAACAIKFDIKDFFPSTTQEHILKVWKSVFRFGDEVAGLLAKLTTKGGFMPQGAKTSSYLANLVFFRDEPTLVKHLAAKGWRYSRLTDDITVSSVTQVTDAEISATTRTVIAFITRNRYHLKRSKLKIYRSNVPMEVNNLLINVHPALPKQERKKIRAQNHQVQRALARGDVVDPITINSTRGKVAKLKRLHPGNIDNILGTSRLPRATTGKAT